MERVKKSWVLGFDKYLGELSLEDCSITDAKWKQEFTGKNHSNIFAEGYLRCKKPLQGRKLTISLKDNYARIQTIGVQVLKENGQVINEKYREKKFNIEL